MNAVIMNPAECIDILDLNSLLMGERGRLINVVNMFNDGVADLRTLIECDKATLHCPVSQGKDSTIVELMAIEAYRQSINEGKVEPGRPLILSTINTGGEAIPMQFYVTYARKRLIAYAKKLGINLFYDIVRPALNSEYFSKYTGGQKLVPNATRRGDCTIILKVDPSERYIKTLRKRFLNCNTEHQYAASKIISCTGVREDESARRSKNMTRQGLSKKNIAELQAELQVENVGKEKLYKYAPIKHWKTADVFDALRLAGDRPITKLPEHKGAIPAFLPNFGLLLEVYGNGSAETCEISIGSNASSGCNGKARFGCVFCTMIAGKDRSSTALASMPRWDALGAGNALKVRDYLFRLSTNIDARALHARAYDPITFNRAALQPNTLKPKYLEKMVRYAAQLSLDAIRIAKEFKQLVEQGKEMDHPGYRDIAEDTNMPPKVKQAFLEMYKECAQDPDNLNTLFSEKHALLLSFRWSIDGIGAAPYRPLAIWNQLSQGEGWIPYPMLNSEYEKIHGPVLLSGNGKALPEAVMMPILKVENATQHALSPVSLLDLWSRPSDISDLYDEDRNCSISRQADHLAELEVQFSHRYSLSIQRGQIGDGYSEFTCSTTEGPHLIRIKYQEPDIALVKLDGKTISADVKDTLIDSGLKSEIEELFYQRLEASVQRLCKNGPLSGDLQQCIANVTSELNLIYRQNDTIKRKVKHLKKLSIFAGYNTEKSRKVEPAINFTRRVTKVVKGVMQRGNTRLSFYPVLPDSRLHHAYKQEISLLVPDFATHTQKQVTSHDASCWTDADSDTLENILIADQALAKWKIFGGFDRAIETHNTWLATRVKNRHRANAQRAKLRCYGGTHVAETLLAEGVISIEKGYWEQLQAILNRTQLFNEIGLFCFQSMSVEDVQSHPKAIPMAQHRKDKVEVLQVIRKHRNKQRHAVKVSNDDLSGLLSESMSVFVDTLNNALAQLECDNAHLLKVRFDTSEVSTEVRANVASLWLSLYINDIKNVDHILDKVLPQSQLRKLKSKAPEYMMASKMIISSLQRTQDYINDTINVWTPLLNAVKVFATEPGTDKETAIHRFKTLIKTLAPHHLLDDSVVDYWKPNIGYMTEHLQKSLKRIDVHIEKLKAVRSIIDTLEANSLRTITQKMTLSQKLALLQQRNG